VQQLQIAASALHGRVNADELADSRTVNVVDVRKIQEDFLPLVVEQASNHSAQERAAVAKGDTPAEINNGDFSGIAMSGAQKHVSP
jgi:hypothetical protein